MSAPAANPPLAQQPAETPGAEVAGSSLAGALPDPWWWLVALALVAALLIYYWRRSGPDPERFERQYELPVRATVPRSRRQGELQRAGQEAPLAAVEPDDPAAQSMRSLRAALYLLMGEGGNRVVTVLSRKAGQGGSFVAANLAVALAGGEGRVLLLDGDLRTGALHRQFGLPDGCGLAELLSGDTGIGSVICGTGVEGLELIPAGCGSPADPDELLGSRRFTLLLKHLGSYRHIVIDTPPLATGGGALSVARLADVALLVLRGERGVGPDIERLHGEGVALHGVVFNRFGTSSRRGRNGRRFGYR